MRTGHYVNKLRDMTDEELHNQEADLREQFFKLRLQWTMGQTEALKKMREVRKSRARLQTILREKSKG